MYTHEVGLTVYSGVKLERLIHAVLVNTRRMCKSSFFATGFNVDEIIIVVLICQLYQSDEIYSV